MARKTPKGKPPSQRGDRLGREQPGAIEPAPPRLCAYHEAGHAVAMVVLGTGLVKVDIKRRALTDGRVGSGFTLGKSVDLRALGGKGEDVARPLVIQVFAGPLAEAEVDPASWDEDACRGDLDQARKITGVAICGMTRAAEGGWTVTEEEQARQHFRLDAFFNECLRAAEQLVQDHWPAIERVTRSLLDRIELTGAEVAATVEASKVTDHETAVS